jgi:1-aminocyclopropane-1-carboxylate synthase
LPNNNISDDIHILWSFSKDLGSSGLRLGVMYTQNKELLKSMSSANDTFMVSNLMQEMAAGILFDRAWIDQYLKELKEKGDSEE